MSDLIMSVPGDIIPASSTIPEVHAIIRGRLTAAGFQVVWEDTTSTPTSATHLVVAPPATEAVGNSQCRDVLRMKFTGTTIEWTPISQALQPYPQSVAIWQKTGGTSSNAVTLNGVTVQQAPSTLAAGNTAANNLRYLYEAIQASTDPAFTDWDWCYEYPAPQNADDSSAIIYGVRKTAIANVTIVPNANVNAAINGNYADAGIQSSTTSGYVPATSVAVDLVNGCLYFLQISARALALGIRASSGYYGVIHACWGDHATALAAMPQIPSMFQRYISPIELIVGTDEGESGVTATAMTAKYWSAGTTLQNCVPNNTYQTAHPFTRAIFRHVLIDSNNNSGTGYFGSNALWTKVLNLIGAGTEYANDYQLLPLQSSEMAGWQHGNDGNPGSYSNQIRSILPPIATTDWWKFVGTAADENLQFGGWPIPCATLATGLAHGGAESTVALTSTSGLPTTGTLCFEREAVTYTGISGNSVIGCTRGANNTEKVAHAAGTPVVQGLWWIKIKGGAIFCGTRMPS